MQFTLPYIQCSYAPFFPEKKPQHVLGVYLIIAIQRIIQIQIIFIHNTRDHKTQASSIVPFWIDAPRFSKNVEFSEFRSAI